MTDMIDEHRLRDFIRESNHIEGIEREPTEAEVNVAARFLNRKEVTVEMLVGAVFVFEPGANLRHRAGMDVRVGNHIAPPGGPQIAKHLGGIISGASIKSQYCTPYSIHCQYETLHPFTDGNGRSGRLLWLWMMTREGAQMPPLGFLHTFYYQTLGASHD